MYFFFNMYISNTQTQLLAYLYPCAEYNCFGIEYSRCLYFFAICYGVVLYGYLKMIDAVKSLA